MNIHDGCYVPQTGQTKVREHMAVCNINNGKR